MNGLLHRIRSVAILLALLSSVAATAPPLYRAQRLPGEVTDFGLQRRWLSDTGEVVYFAKHNSPSYSLYVWSAGQLRQLPSLSVSPQGPAFAWPHGVYSGGTVAGYAVRYAGGTWLGERAVLWPPAGGIVEIGTLGTDAAGYGESYAFVINDSGVVAGGSTLYSPQGRDLGNRGVVWRNGQLLALSHVPFPGWVPDDTFVHDLDSAGRTVGISRFWLGDGYLTRATLWTPQGQPTDLGSLYDRPGKPGLSSAAALNNRGDVVGFSGPPSGDYYEGRATLWSGERMIDLGHIEPSPPRSNYRGPAISWAYAVNNRGEVLVATETLANPTKPYVGIWRAGRLHELRPPPPAGPKAYVGASDLNDQGIVVGSGERDPPPEYSPYLRAMVARDGMVFLDLNELVRPEDLQGWTLTRAVAINRRGQILVEGENGDGLAVVAFVLTPLD